MARFRKIPVEIDAIQFNDLDDYLRIVEWMKENGDTSAIADEARYETPIMLIRTLEGTMAAHPGDWIIRGVEGEFYPCRDDIFRRTYMPIESLTPDQVSELRDAFNAIVNDPAWKHKIVILPSGETEN